ncbi:MAG: hypothetical protein C0594_09350, partial [Marinilabiliales bacterium]
MLVCPFVNGQILVDVKEQRLEDVLYSLKNKYNLAFSIDHKLASDCLLTVQSNFKNLDKAVEFLTRECGYAYRKRESVFIIYKADQEELSEDVHIDKFLIRGQVIDEKTGESLPYADVIYDSVGVSCNEKGYFSIKPNKEELYVEIRYLGYYSKDTVLLNNQFSTIKLTPGRIGLKEVLIESSEQHSLTTISNNPGMIKLNFKTANFLPGNHSNSLLQYLRLQPGVLAAGEQSKDYFIWGSYLGQTKINFDGITLFSISNSFEELSIVNPLMIKEIEVYKGAYPASIDGRSGAIMNIIGKDGDNSRIRGALHMNDKTTSGLISVPIGQQLVLQTAFRNTYFDLFKFKNNQNLVSSDYDKLYDARYKYQDVNMKLSGKTSRNSSYYLSFIESSDQLYSEYYNDIYNKKYSIDASSKEVQHGANFSFIKNWKHLGISQYSLSYTILNLNRSNSVDFKDEADLQENTISTYNLVNRISEYNLKLQHTLPVFGKNSIDFGASIRYNMGFYVLDTSENSSNKLYSQGTILSAYAEHIFQPFKSLKIISGLRVESTGTDVAVLPRFSSELKLRDHLKAKLSWGIYKQYMNEMTIIDELGNQIFYWNICDGKKFPYQKSMHTSLGLGYKADKIYLGAEVYYRITDQLSRFYENNNDLNLSIGKSKVRGIDLTVRKTVYNHDLMLAYTYSKAEEYFDYFDNEEYMLA